MRANVFPAKLDLLAKIITNLFLAGMLVLLFFSFKDRGYDNEGFFISLLLLPLTVIAWGFHPSSYEINKESLIIKRPFKSLEISLSSIDSARTVSFRELFFSLRVFGSGGLFGYFGIYTSMSLGKIQMWATDRNNLVLIEVANQKFVISPQNPSEFIMNLKLSSKQIG